MDSSLLDDHVESIEWSNIGKVVHLDPTKTYHKLLLEINDCLDPRCNLFMKFDYESIQLLLKQAHEFDVPFIHSDELVAMFILECNGSKLKERLFLELGYGDKRKTGKILDTHLYKNICAYLEKNMDIQEIQEYHKLVLDEVFQDDLFTYSLRLYPHKYAIDSSYYFDQQMQRRLNGEIATLFYLDFISDYFFDDYYNNVCMDIQQMMKYIHLTFNKDIPKDRLAFYEEFVGLKDLSFDEQTQFYNNHKDIHIIDEFYDDIRVLKDDSYQSLVDSCTSFNKNSSLYNKELSETYGCDIYYLDGQEFFGFVRSDVGIQKRQYDGQQMVDTPVPTGDEIRRLGHSFTYIGKDDIQTYKHPNEFLTMLYTGINPQNIGHVYHNDSWTNPSYYYYSDLPNELHTPESLLQESTKYPELLITQLEGIEPCALLCLDQVTDWDVEFSKKNHLPIVLINSKKYERKYDSENLQEERYTR